MPTEMIAMGWEGGREGGVGHVEEGTFLQKVYRAEVE